MPQNIYFWNEGGSVQSLAAYSETTSQGSFQGYQYADTVTLSYSAWLYAQFAKELRAGTGPVAVGQALVKAKQDYLNSLATFGGMDQKALLESALYGLPMVGIDECGVVWLRADGYDLYPYHVTPGVFREFLSIQQVAKAAAQSRDYRGDALTPPVRTS